MTDQEVNKIIAEFMGYRDDNTNFDKMIHSLGTYTTSLDAIIPVWKKFIEFSETDIRQHFGYHKGYRYFIKIRNPYYGDDDTYGMSPCFIGKHADFNICKAAAHATAKAILELTKEDI